MLTRRIAASACVLCLAVPGLAAAKPADVQHAVPVVATGDTKNDLHVNQYEQAIAGDTQGHLPRAIVPGPAVAPATTKVAVVKATPVAGDDSSTDGWQIAALAEGALLAAFAVGGFALVSSRSRRNAQPGV
jgi:hypothetical protein